MARFNVFTIIAFPIKLLQRLFSKKSKNPEMAKQLYNVLGFSPSHIEYYEHAFTHRSAAKANTDGSPRNNERLEYLGDAILGAVVADLLFHKFPFEDEGFLTQMRSKIVSRENLNSLAKEIGITKFIVSNTSGSSAGKHIHGDTFEAFIGAIYLDKGYKRTEHFIVNRMIKNYVDLEKLENSDSNYKSQLIEWGQKLKKEIKFATNFEGEDSKVFVAKIIVDNIEFGSGKGKSKKEAEQLAAKSAMKRIERDFGMPEDLPFFINE